MSDILGAFVWMAGSREGVAVGAYTLGPSRSRLSILAHMDDNDILVGKDRNGKVVEAYDGANNLDPYTGKVE